MGTPQGAAYVAADWTGNWPAQVFNAVGDGVTDDAAAINAAVAKLKSVGGGRVLLGPGTYKLSSSITIDDKRISLEGSGQVGTVLAPDAGVTAILMECPRDSGVWNNRIHRTSICDLTVNGGNRATTVGIKLTDAASGDVDPVGFVHVSFKRISLQYCASYGFYCNSIELLYATFEQMHFFACGVGCYIGTSVAIATPAAQNVIQFTNCEFQSCTTDGLYWDGDAMGALQNNQCNGLYNCSFEGNGRYGIYLASAVHMILDACYFEQNGYTDDSGDQIPDVYLATAYAIRDIWFRACEFGIASSKQNAAGAHIIVGVGSSGVYGPIRFDGCQFQDTTSTGTDLEAANATTAAPYIKSATYQFNGADDGQTLSITGGTNWLVDTYTMGSSRAGIMGLGKACGSSATLTGGEFSITHPPIVDLGSEVIKPSVYVFGDRPKFINGPMAVGWQAPNPNGSDNNYAKMRCRGFDMEFPSSVGRIQITDDNPAVTGTDAWGDSVKAQRALAFRLGPDSLGTNVWWIDSSYNAYTASSLDVVWGFSSIEKIRMKYGGGGVTDLINKSGKILAKGGIGVGNDAAATTLGSVVGKFEVFDEEGVSLGFVPIYNTIS